VILKLRFLMLAALVSAHCHAEYFTDQAFAIPKVSGDFADSTYGLFSNPLVFGACIFPEADSCYANAPQVFYHTNQFKNYPEPFTITPWNLHYNNEFWAQQQDGIPGQSILPSTDFANSTLGFNAIQGSEIAEQKFRAHLSINQIVANPHPAGQDASLPHISIGEFTSRTGNTIGYLNDITKPRKVSFNTRVWRSLGKPNSLHFTQIYAYSEWGGKPRAVFINLFERNFQLSYNPFYGGGPGLRYPWNWPIVGSMFYPGADIGLYDGFPIGGAGCAGAVEGQKITDTVSNHRFVVDLQRAFECANNWGFFETPMPTNVPLPIKIVGWSTEGAYDQSFLWTSVDSMKMHKSSDIIPIAAVSPAGADGTFVSQQKQLLNARCWIGAGCASLMPEVATRGLSSVEIISGTPANIAIGTTLTVGVRVLPAAFSINKRVQITEGTSECFAQLNTAGEGSCSITPVTPGVRTLTVNFAGDEYIYGSVASRTLEIAPIVDLGLTHNAIRVNGKKGSFTTTHTFAVTAPAGTNYASTARLDIFGLTVLPSAPTGWTCAFRDLDQVRCTTPAGPLSEKVQFSVGLWNSGTMLQLNGTALLTSVNDPDLSNNQVNDISF
jgi:hypothetical protein